MLESPPALQSRTGHIEVGGATLDCGKESAWLFASPATGRHVAAYHGLLPAPLTLTVPGDKIEIAAMGTGTVVWYNGEVAVETVNS
ncbi:MAG TPA: hypothetical protein PLJ78_01395 [Anaerolineae bacterium]|nr:hypothetical protein [Anaerolineae bacterium]HQK12578.1 hypothetical protein [Anaerolineae bacterium]